MRRGMENSFECSDADGVFQAVNLGADYVAEHEWGIGRLQSDFAIDGELRDDNLGVDRRRVRHVPNGLVFVEDAPIKIDRKTVKVAMLKYGSYFDEEGKYEVHHELIPHQDWDTKKLDELTTAWSERDFGMVTTTDQGRVNLKELHEAFLKNDVAIWFGGGGVFKKPGLFIGIISRLEQEFLDKMVAVDEDVLALNRADEATGIKKRLDEAGKASHRSNRWIRPFSFYALRPKWASEIKSTKDGEIKTEHDVIYWLNPMEQDKNNFGWYTVEQLDAWIRGEGPIPKKEAA